MIIPNKVVTLEDSALGLLDVVLEQGPERTQLIEVYQRVSRHFESIDQFMLAIDLLYVLGRIEINFEDRTLIYVN